MTTIAAPYAGDAFVVPSLARLAARLAQPARKPVPRKQTVSVALADISEASLRAATSRQQGAAVRKAALRSRFLP